MIIKPTPFRSLFFLLFVLLTTCFVAQAQFSLTGQLRTRSELRDGQGNLHPKGAVPAFFTSQRTRLNVGYNDKRYQFFVVLQDVRVWGQDRSTINRNTLDPNDGLMLHEAWGEIILADSSNSRLDNFSVKLGRQELVYDDERLLGGLGWLQQGRRHDAIIFKLNKHSWTAHAGFAYNQNAEYKNQPKSGQVFNPVPDQTYTGPNTIYPAGTNGIVALYKAMEFLYISKKTPIGTPSFLFFRDDFSKYHFASTDSAKLNPIYGASTWGRMTTGVFLPFRLHKKLSLTTSAFYQFGKDRTGKNLSAYLLSMYSMYTCSKKFGFGPGIDYTSGNDGTQPASTNHQFDPLYGTPHKFWGYMDYFYVADPFSNGGARNGLIDYYMKTKVTPNEKWLLTADLHGFALSNKQTDATGALLSKNLGAELDLVASYNLAKAINLEAGYSSFFATPSLAATKVKNVPDASLQSNWAYLMITIKPDFLAKK